MLPTSDPVLSAAKPSLPVGPEMTPPSQCELPQIHLRSPEQPSVVTPTEGFLDQFARPQAQHISRMASRALVKRGPTVPFSVLSNMRCHIERANMLNKLAHVIGFVGADSAACRTTDLREHFKCCAALGGPVRLSEPRIDDEPVAVLTECTPQIGQLRERARILFVELCLRVARR